MKRHAFHLVTYSPWPLLVSFSVFNFVIGLVMYFNFYSNFSFLILSGLFGILYYMYIWWRDVIREATFEGVHTKFVQKGLRLGMLLFIVSEVMFFFSFFWAFFHSSLAPTIEIGAIWPPIGIFVFNPWDVPLLNTLILLLSGSSITLAHYSLIKKNNNLCFFGFIYTIGLAVLFTLLQFYEYCEAFFVINDGIYGSLFYMLTGFHGFHVIIGTIFIVVCFIRYLKGHFSSKHHFGFEAAIWYWHFVDVVWLFLFVCVYWWGNYYYFTIKV